MSNGGWTGWDIIERYERHIVRLDDEQVGGPIPLGTDVVATALLVEMERPPWWRDIDTQRKQLARETA